MCRILKNADKYPGKHNTPTERTNPNQKPLEAKSQVGRPLCSRNSFFLTDAYHLERSRHLSRQQPACWQECQHPQVRCLHLRHRDRAAQDFHPRDQRRRRLAVTEGRARTHSPPEVRPNSHINLTMSFKRSGRSVTVASLRDRLYSLALRYVRFNNGKIHVDPASSLTKTCKHSLSGTTARSRSRPPSPRGLSSSKASA